jgi:hypothetical protein
MAVKAIGCCDCLPGDTLKKMCNVLADDKAAAPAKAAKP